jgi:hypothetical protein
MKKSLMFAMILILSGCAAVNQKFKGDWSENMNRMMVTFTALLPDIYNEESFQKPENRNELEIKIARLAKQTQFVNTHAGNLISGNDPLFSISIENLQSSMDRAYESFKEGKYQQSQVHLQNSINFCFQCHLSNKKGIEIKSWSQWNPPETLNGLQKAKALGATRQFSKAIDALTGYLHQMQPVAKKEGELVSSIQILIQMGLYRNQNSQDLVANIKSIMNQKNKSSVSSKTKNLISRWMDDLSRIKPVQSNEHQTTLKKLLKKDPAKMRYAELKFVQLVRDSMVYRQGLQNTRFFDTKAKILYRLGYSYRNFPIDGAAISNEYFEKCILLVSTSKLSRNCHKALTDNLLSQYKVKKVEALPKNEQKYLNRLQSVAFDKFRALSPGMDYYGR